MAWCVAGIDSSPVYVTSWAEMQHLCCWGDRGQIAYFKSVCLFVSVLVCVSVHALAHGYVHGFLHSSETDRWKSANNDHHGDQLKAAKL